MRTPTKPHEQRSPLAVLTELAVEGTSSLVEAQRALLNLAQQENEILLNGIKERVGGFLPAAAMTDLVRRSFDTLIGMQQELLTATSRQTLEWLEAEKAGKGGRAARAIEFAREGVETFAHAQKKFLEVVAQEAARATSGKLEQDPKGVKKTELKHLAAEAGAAFIEAQKRLLEVMGQQMNVNLDVTSRTLEFVSPSKLFPIADLTSEGVKRFVDTETSLIGSLIAPRKKAAGVKRSRARATAGRKKVVAV